MDKNVEKDLCGICGRRVPSYSTVYLSSQGKQTLVCMKCYNQEISNYTGFDFEHVEFEPVMIKDADGEDHKFHFVVRHLGDRFTIETFEIKDGHPGGYEFSIIDNIQEEPHNLFQKLIVRMRRALDRSHITWDETTRNWQITDSDLVRGRIDSGLDSDGHARMPLIIIDGKEITWNEFGKMLTTYEGFNFKLEIFDRSDEMP